MYKPRKPRLEDGTFWELLGKLGACHQAELEAATGGQELQRDASADNGHIFSSLHTVKSDKPNGDGRGWSAASLEMPDAPASPSQDDAVLTRSMSGSSIESVRVEGKKPSLDGSLRVRVPSKLSYGSFEGHCDTSEGREKRVGEAQHARVVGHALQEQLACRGEKSTNSLQSLQDDAVKEQEIFFQPWQAWSPDDVRRRARRRRQPSRPATSIEDSPGTEALAAAETWMVLSPVGRAQVVRDILTFSFVTVDLTFLPLRVFQEVSPGWVLWSLLWMSQIYWNLHMVVSFNTGYYFRGHLVRDRNRIAQHYLRTLFFFDALNITVDWLLAGLDTSHNFVSHVLFEDVSMTVLCLWVLQMCLRLCRMFMSFSKLAVSDTVRVQWVITRTVGQILLTHHVMACAWYRIGSASARYGWTKANGLDDTSLSYKYTTSLHWTYCQLGFGSSEIEAVNTAERVFSLLVVFAALVVFSTLLAAITSLATKLNKASERKQEHFRQLRKYLRQHQIEEDLRLRVVAFLEHAYTLRQAVVADSEVPILDLLSKPLQAELNSFKYMKCLRELDVMRQLFQTFDQHSVQAIRSLPKAFSHRTFAPADTVFECGLLANSAYFVAEGEFVYELNGEMISVENGRWVAEMSLWTPWLHLGDLTTRDISEVIVLDVSHFADTLSRSSESFLKCQEYAEQLTARMNEERILTDLWRCEVNPARSGSDNLRGSVSLAARLRSSFTRHVLQSPNQIVPVG